uniref:Obscurin-like protein 1 n=1 Tax=Monodelphis domestica TaxID=13616 RepID=A0A5F8H2L6_MONDO
MLRAARWQSAWAAGSSEGRCSKRRSAVLGGAPRFLRFPRPVRAVSGADAVLRCCLTGAPAPTVLWEKDGQQLEASSRLCLQTEGTEHSLLVREVGAPDAGVYVCRAQNSSGEAYAAAALTVQEPSEAAPVPSEGTPSPLDTDSTFLSSDPPLEGPPVFLEGPRCQWVQQGEDVVLACQVGGQPEPAVHWEKDGRLLEDVWESSHFSLTRGPAGDGSHALRIRGIRLPDAGVYVCHASNAHGGTVAAALLQIQPSAEAPLSAPHQGQRASAGPGQGPAAPKSFWVSEGKHAKFRCYVTGKPEPETEWHWEGQPLSPGRRRLLYRDHDGGFVLKVLYCQPSDCGLYVCAARNTAGHTLSAVQLHVREPRVRFAVPLEDVEGEEGGAAVLECQVPSRGITTTWYREDQRLLPGPKYEMGEAGVMRRLIIHDLEADDDGIYLCEMRGRVRTVAAVAVKGPITRRLPRKLDVLEGENAVLSVEVRGAKVLGRWTRDGQELPASPRIIQTSSNHTHTLVLVGVTRQDAGVVTFSLGSSHTSSRLRVKCMKQVPPGPPVSVELGTGCSNAALLSWKPPVPAPDTAFTYRLERQEVGTDAWVQCLTTEAAGMVEVPGDGMPNEGDYRFRLCVVSEHGQSPYILFPGSVHLGESLSVSGLQDVCVQEGDDATFSLELSTSAQGAWFLNGAELKAKGPESGSRDEVQGYLVQQHGPHHSLLLRATRPRDSGALITFLCPGVHISATLHVQEAPVRIVLPQEKVSIEAKSLEQVVLLCELSRAGAPVHWYKDGLEIEESQAMVLENEGLQCRLVIPAAQPQHGGEFVCKAGEDSAFFMVTIKEPPVKILFPQDQVCVAAESSERVVLSCELSQAGAPVHWYKDGMVAKESETLLLERKGLHCHLILPAAQPQDGGKFVCKAGDDQAVFHVTITVQIVQPQDEMFLTAVTSERVVLMCQVSQPRALVGWYKNGMEVEESKYLVLESEGLQHRLVLPSVRLQDGGEFVCSTRDDSAFFTLTVTDPPVRIVSPQDMVSLASLSSERVVLKCELSRAGVPVRWYKDGLEVEESRTLILENEGPHHRLILPAAQPQDGGKFVCKAGEDSAFFNVTITEPPVKILFPRDELQFRSPGRVELRCEVAPVGARVCWYKDGLEVEASEDLKLGAEGPIRTLTLPQARPQDAGEYVCETRDEAVSFDIRLAGQLRQFLEPEWISVVEDGNLELRSEGTRRMLFIRAAHPSHAGNYTCQAGCEPAAPTLTFPVQVSEIPQAKLVLELTPLTIQEGDDATFRCEVFPADAELTWLLNGTAITPCNRIETSQNGPNHTLTLRCCQISDSGTVTAQTEGSESTARLHVREAELLFLRRLQDARTEEGQELSMEVETSRVGGQGIVTWLRGGKPLPEDPRFSVVQDGRVHRLIIHKVMVSDQGIYCCKSHHDRTQARLLVRPEQLKVRHPLEDVVVTEGGSATFQLELSQSGVTGEWARGGVRLEPGRNCQISAQGHNHCLVLSGLGLADTGTVSFTTDTLRCAARLEVKEIPLAIVKGLQDLEVIEGDSATFECELSRTQADLTWDKDGQELSPSPRLRIQALGSRRLLQLRCCGPKDAGTYSCCVGNSQASAARLTVRKKEVSVLQELKPVKAREGDGATFKCTVSQPGIPGSWQLGGRVLRPGGRVRIRQEGNLHSLALSELQAEDSGEIQFQAGQAKSSTHLEVEVLPLQICRRPPREKTVLAGRRAALEVTVSRGGGHVRWLLGGVDLPPGPKYEFRSHGVTHSLIIHNVQPTDEGTYCCQAGEDSANTNLLVESE